MAGVLGSLLIGTTSLQSAQAFARVKAPRERFRSDRILVKARPETGQETMRQWHWRRGIRRLRHYPQLGNLEVIEVPAGKTAKEMIALYQQSGLVEFAEPDYTIQLSSAPADPYYANGTQWALHNTGQSGGKPGADIKANEAWNTLSGAGNVIVCVIDSGVRYTHEDLAANMWTNPGESGLDAQGRDKRFNKIDDDGDGYIDDVYGINAVTGSGDPLDNHGHGTHVSGIIGAVGDNGRGVAGVAWKVRLMACKFMDNTGYGSISDAVESIAYARSHGARIINASWGGTDYSTPLYNAIKAASAEGIIFVTAAGNDGWDNETHATYPANYNLDNLVSVAASTRNDTLAYFSNYGANAVDLAAPGDTIYSTAYTSDSSYAFMSGTSMASPQVAGALALLSARFPQETPRSLISRLYAATDPLPALAGKCVTDGRLNLARALGPSSLATEVAPAKNLAGFSLPFYGEINRSYLVEGSTNLISWTPVSTNLSDNTGKIQFQDVHSAQYPKRFYRLRPLP